MDWLRQFPIGQYVSGKSGWLRKIDPRLKLGWVLMFLVTPIWAGPFWRVGLVASLITVTLFSCLPLRIWWRSICLLLLLAVLVGAFAMFLPTGEPTATLPVRFPHELSDVVVSSSKWHLLKLGPLKIGPLSFGPLLIDKRSLDLGLNSSTLIFTVIHSVNLMLLTTAPEDLMWTIRWFLTPLSVVGFPVERISFQLLLSLRFLPLVQEEFQNLLRSLASRAVSLKKLGFKASLRLILSVGERLLANILLRAEQGADAFIAKGGTCPHPEEFKPKTLLKPNSLLINLGSGTLLLLFLGLRGKYGAL